MNYVYDRAGDRITVRISDNPAELTENIDANRTVMRDVNGNVVGMVLENTVVSVAKESADKLLVDNS